MSHPQPRPQQILALDCAFGETAACVITPEASYCSPAAPQQGGITRSTTIMPLLHDLLQQAQIDWQQLDLLAFAAGPGSFTGLRIAAATLAGINSGLHLPILHLDALAITARQAADISNQALWVVEDARADEAFIGCYRQGATIEPARCCRWSEIAAMVRRQPAAAITGQRLPEIDLPLPVIPLRQDRASALMAEAVAQRHGDTHRYPQPRYLQRSQAERSLDAAD